MLFIMYHMIIKIKWQINDDFLTIITNVSTA
jgi:hypothetical protein